MIEANNNAWNLAMVEIATPDMFAVGATLLGRSLANDWMVHWRDETTLLITPTPPSPPASRPAHIYRRVEPYPEAGRRRVYRFFLTPNSEAKRREQRSSPNAL